MFRVGAITLVVLVLAGSVVSGAPLEYRIEGVAEYREGPDTGLDGAYLTIVLGIDSEAEPFDLIEGEYARYHFVEGSVALTIAGSVASDGTYPGSGEFNLTLTNLDIAWYDALSIGPNLSEGGTPFVIPGTDVYAFGIRLVDYMAQALDSVAVPTAIDVESFPSNRSWLKLMTNDEPVYGYDIVDLAISVTEGMPEPSTLSLLALGAVALLRRRRMS